MKIKDLLQENGTSGGTTSGSIASIPNAGGPMMPMIRRMPPGQSFFSPPVQTKIQNKQRIKRKKPVKDK